MGIPQIVQERVPTGRCLEQRSIWQVVELLLLGKTHFVAKLRFGTRRDCSLGNQILAQPKGMSGIRRLRRKCQRLQVLIIDIFLSYSRYRCRFYKHDDEWVIDKVIDVKPKKVSGWISDYMQGI